jgi:5-methylthioadenosine/S-adenosylhomocysteine deaminase
MTSILIKSAVVLCLDSTDQIYENGYLIVENDSIVEIGFQKDLNLTHKFDQVVDLGLRLVMPGLINAHTHSPMTLFRGHVEGHSIFNLKGWYNTIRVLELEMTPDMISPGVAVSCAEMIRTGTTCFVDQYFWMDQIYPVVRQSGMRAALAYGIVELGEEEARKREIAAASKFLDELSGDPLLDGWVGPHAFFVDNSEAAMLMEKELVEKHHTGFHIHFATSQSENKYCQEKYGHSAIKQLEAMGFLKYPIVAAHSIGILEEDYPVIKDKPFTPIFAPSSGMRNAAGLAPLLELREAGINVALGTDNVTNNNSYDMFKEMALTGKLMALLHRDAAAIPTRYILEMATINGAKTIGREKEIGSLEKGKKADLIALDLDETGWTPFGGQDYYAALVYAVGGYHVKDVMVNGRWLYRDNHYMTIDFAQAKKDLESKHTELMSRIAKKEKK